MNQLDVLIICAHPDDAEISVGGCILKWVKEGKKVGIVDLTMGERGSRGSGELRLEEAKEASKRLDISIRENLQMPDCFFEHNEANKLQVIDIIRKYRPTIVLTNALSDRHPDHARAAKLVADASFYSGLAKIETSFNSWRPKACYHFNQDYYNEPDFVIDITDFIDEKIQVLHAFKSQFYDPASVEPETPISGSDFFDFIRARARDFGRPAGYKYAEGFMRSRTFGVKDLFNLD
jgi:bacillithiol biosynthesis deacetylase BshB1